jgi:hypothetical protein
MLRSSLTGDKGSARFGLGVMAWQFTIFDEARKRLQRHTESVRGGS